MPADRDFQLQAEPWAVADLDRLFSWLDLVHGLRSTTDEADDLEENLPYIHPPDLIVGTRADETFEDIMEVEKCIKKSISGKKHIIRPFFAVDNTGSSIDDEVQSLWNKNIEVLKQEPYMRDDVPIRCGAINNQSSRACRCFRAIQSCC